MGFLLTGGAGYIGSHAAVALAGKGHPIVCFDNLSQSHVSVIERLNGLTGSEIKFIHGDVRDTDLLKKVLKDHDITAVLHFAGAKAVGESVALPLTYYDNNLGGTLSLLEAMSACDVKKIVFSSSATVYGRPQQLPLDENHPTCATNPYGRTKLMVEEVLNDLALADPEWRIAILRYFNPVGAHPSGLIGEDPGGTPQQFDALHMPSCFRKTQRALCLRERL